MRYLLFSAALLAANLTAGQDLDSRITLLEEQMKDLRVETMNGNYGAKTVSAYPSLSSWGAYASVEGLYMKFTEGGTDYAYDEFAGSSISYTGRTKYLDFDWRFAFRVTAGYQFANPDWDTWLEYMRFETTQRDITTVARGGSIDSNIFVSTGVLQRAKMKLWVNFNVADWNVGRSFFLRKNVSVHPFGSIRGAWIFQHENTPTTAPFTGINLSQKNDYWGVGLRSGSQIRWHLSKNWSVFGSGAASLMFGEFSNRATLYQSSGVDQSVVFKVNLGKARILPNAMIDAGISWEMAFACDRSRVRISAGYEFDYWWRQNQTVHINSEAAYSYFRYSEDLALQGVKLNAAFDF